MLNHQCENRPLQRLILKPKQYLFRQGESLSATYILRDGWIQLYRITEDGKRQVFRSILPGEALGIQADPHSPSIYSAIALENCVVCAISNMEELCLTEPKLALRLTWASACDLILTEIYLTHINQRNAREKIAFLALELYRRLEFRGMNDGYSIPFPLKQEDIADTLGMTPIHVNRTLHELKKENILIVQKHVLTILDYETICSLAGGELEAMSSCDIAAD